MNLDLFRPREKFLILEITPKGTNGLFLSVDEDRNIIFEKMAKGGDLKKFLKSPARRLRDMGWEGKKFWNGRRRVIAAADPALATTIPVPLALEREHANVRTKITIAELENLIAQGMAKIFNASRSEAAKRLAAHELDTVLVGARAKHFKVDGKAFASPVGAAGKKIALILEFTFTTRAIFEDLKPFFNSPEEFFFAEAPQAELRALARVHSLPLNLVAAGDEGASLYVLEELKGEHAVLYREKLDWSFAAFVRAIMKELAVTEAVAKNLYCLYERGLISEGAKRAFKGMTDPVLKAFLAALKKGKVKGPVYIDVPHALPLPLPYKHGRAVLAEHPVREILDELGFSAPREAFAGDNAALRSLLYFIEAYFDRSNAAEINQKLRRRLHWLAA